MCVSQGSIGARMVAGTRRVGGLRSVRSPRGVPSQLSTMEALAEGGMERRGSVYDRIRSWLHTQAVQDLDQFKGEPIGKKVLNAPALAAEREPLDSIAEAARHRESRFFSHSPASALQFRLRRSGN